MATISTQYLRLTMKSYSPLLPLLLLLLCSFILSVETATSDKMADILHKAEDKEVISKRQLNALLNLIRSEEETSSSAQEEPTLLSMLSAYMSFSTTHTLIFVVTIIGFAVLCKSIPAAAIASGFCTVTVLLPYFFRAFILHIGLLLILVAVVDEDLKKHPALKDKPERLNIAETAVVIGYLAVGKFIGTVFGGSVWFYLAGIIILITSVGQKSNERDITVIMKDILLRKEVPDKADITTISCLGIKVFTALVMLLIASNSTDVLTALACFVTVNYEIRRSLFWNGDEIIQVIYYFVSTQSIISITVWIAFLVLDHSYFLAILTLPVTIIQALENNDDIYKTRSIHYTGVFVFVAISEYFQYTILRLISYALLVLFPFIMTDKDRVTVSYSLAIFAVVLVPVSFKFIAILYSPLMSIATCIIASIATVAFLRFKKTSPSLPPAPAPPPPTAPIECVICTNTPDKPLFSPCCQRIVGCSACVERWLATSSNCPHCNSRASLNNFKEVKGLF